MLKWIGGFVDGWSPYIEPEDRGDVDHTLFVSNVSHVRALAWLTVAINIVTFVAVSFLLPKFKVITVDVSVGHQILALRVVLLAGALGYLLLSRGASQSGPILVQKIYARVFVGLLLCGLALHTGIFQAIRPLITPYLIGIFAVASLVYLSWRATLLVFIAAWVVAIVAQVAYQPDKALLSSNLIHIATMTIIAVAISRLTYRFKVNEIIAKRKIESLSLTDQLTGLANRRLMDRKLREEWGRCKRGNRELAVLLADVDYFKSFNDSYGHQAGDKCLREVGRILLKTARRTGDLVARYGGEEFLVILPDTDMKGAAEIADTIRSSVEGLNIRNECGLNETLTVSLGVASVTPSDSEDVQSLVKAADNALYKAKLEGRNRLAFAEAPETPLS